MNYNERILLENYILQEIVSLDEEMLNEISVKNAARNAAIAAGLYLAAQKGYNLTSTNSSDVGQNYSQQELEEEAPKPGDYDEDIYRYYIKNPVAMKDQIEQLNKKAPDNPLLSLMGDLFISGEGEAEYDGSRMDAEEAERLAQYEQERNALMQFQIDTAEKKYPFFEDLTPELLRQIHDGDREVKIPEAIIDAFKDDDFLVEYFDDMLNRNMTNGDTTSPESAAKHIISILSSQDKNIDNVRAVSSIADDFLMPDDFISDDEYLPSLLSRYEKIAKKPGERNRMLNNILPSLQDFVYSDENN